MALPLLHAGTGAGGVPDVGALKWSSGGAFVWSDDDYIVPSLDLNFALFKDLRPRIGPTPTFTRASGNATYFNSSGVLTTAAINGPRFDHVYNGSAWVSKGLLIEEARTNSLNYSEDFTGSAYTKNLCTVSSNTATAPDGTTTADLVYPTGSSGGFYYAAYSGTSQYSASVFAKSYGKSFFYFYAHDGAALGASFNLSNGTVSNVLSGNSATITNVGNGWYRCTLTSPSPALYNLWQVAFQDAQGPGQTVTPNGTDGILFWGAQRELGAFPTSYIPTTTAAVTRSADVCEITGGDFSGFYNQTEGSFAVAYDCPANGSMVQYQANSAGATNLHNAVSIGTTQYFQVYLPPEQALLNAGSIAANVSQSLSSAYKINDFAASLNGNAVATDTAGSLPTPTKLIIGADGTSYINGHIARLRYFNTRLTNSQLQVLST